MSDSGDHSELKRLDARCKELLAETEKLERHLAALLSEAQGIVDDTILFPQPAEIPGPDGRSSDGTRAGL